MAKKMLILVGVVGGMVAMASLCSAVQVDGHAYLGGQTNHEGIKVLFQEDSPTAVTDSTYSDSTGYYLIEVSPGFYDIFFTYEGFGGEEILDQNCFSSVTLLVVTLYIHLSGPLSGIIEANPYVIDDFIHVESSDSLYIEPGVMFYFDGEFDFNIMGYINAIGTEEDSIQFMPRDGVASWWGIEFGSSASDSSILKYCIITESNKMGIEMNHSNPTISHCTITDNSTPGGYYYGAGIRCEHSNPIIQYSSIYDNFSSWKGGGISCIYDSNPLIYCCTISDNQAPVGGGIYCENSNPTILNTIIEGNSGGIYFNYNSSNTYETVE